MARTTRAVRRPDRARRSPGVILRARAAGLGYWDDEINADGGKAKLHRRVRRTEKATVRREIAQELAR